MLSTSSSPFRVCLLLEHTDTQKRTKGIPHNGIGLTLFFFFYASLSRHVSAPVHAYRLSSFSPLLLFFLNRIFIYIYSVFFSFLLSKLRFVFLSRLAIGVSRTKKIDLMGSLLFLVSGFVEFNDVDMGYRGSWNTAPFFGCVLFSVSSFFFFFLHFYSCHSRIRQPRCFKKKKKELTWDREEELKQRRANS